MKLIELPRTVLRVQYEIARYPLYLIQRQLDSRMDHEAPVRLLFERSLGRLDGAVGTTLGAPEVAQRGAKLVEHSDALRRASQLDATAANRAEQADSELRGARRAAKHKHEGAHADKANKVAEARSDSAERKQEAVSDANQQVRAETERVEEEAAQRKNAVETVKNKEQRAIQASERRATAEADEGLGDAHDKKDDAAAKRADAIQVEKLAKAERSARQRT